MVHELYAELIHLTDVSNSKFYEHAQTSSIVFSFRTHEFFYEGPLPIKLRMIRLGLIDDPTLRRQ
jgi:hypothetical protein